MYSDFEHDDYDVAILGNDPVTLQLAERVCQRFARVVLIENSDPVIAQAVAGLSHLTGRASFESEHRIRCETAQGTVLVSARQIIIATGSNPVSPRWMIEHPRVVCDRNEDSLEQFDCIAIAGKETVKLVSGEDRVLKQVIESGIIGLSQEREKLRLFLASGKSVLADAVVATQLEQRGCTSFLNLESIGLFADDRGCLWCNENYETWVDGIYAVGDVVGFPAAESPVEDQIKIVMNSMLAQQTVSV